MFLNCWKNASESIFKIEYRRQLLVTLSVTIISFSHGIGLGWISPMLVKLQSAEETPLKFSLSVEEASWLGAFISLGGFSGNLIFCLLLDRIGRKIAIYLLAVPHVCAWILLYFANRLELLYLARFTAGLTGGGIYIVLPIFIGEIADASIRGRLISIFTVNINIGILVGFIVSSHLPYHVIPCIIIVLPLIYLFCATLFPETPQHLLRCGQDASAEQALRFYRHVDGASKAEIQKIDEDFAELKLAVVQQKSETGTLTCNDFLNKRSLKAICTGIVIMLLNIFSGTFVLINYMSTIFGATKTQLDPDTNTIIIGVVQIIGTFTSTALVDRFGRKILMLISTGGMGVGLAAFGMYAFFAEETEVDLSTYSWWLPLLLMSFIIFIANVGVISVSFVLIVEIMPAKIRSKATSFCLGLLSLFAFTFLKIFPIFMQVFGLSASMWFCASVCALGLFYISIFLEETKGKSLDKDEVVNN